MFLQFAAIYPYKFSGQFHDEKSLSVAKSEWYQGLKDLTERDIRRGLDRLRKEGSDFPPSIPEFRKLCALTWEDFGILHEEEAFLAFIKKDYSDEIVCNVKNRIDLFQINRLPRYEAKKEFLSAYKLCVNEYLSQFGNNILRLN